MSKLPMIDAFFTNANKSSVLATIPEQSKAAVPSTSFVMVAEIHNVDVPGPSNRDATVLSPTVDTLPGLIHDRGRNRVGSRL